MKTLRRRLRLAAQRLDQLAGRSSPSLVEMIGIESQAVRLAEELLEGRKCEHCDGNGIVQLSGVKCSLCDGTGDL